MKILFQGDSITDTGRDRANPRHLGNGYARFASLMLQERFPDTDFDFLNQGISGNRTCDLKARWQTDCIDFEPDIVSILIGINDVWRAFDSNNPMSPSDFEDNYRWLLEELKAKTSAKIVMLEPFLLITSPDRARWHTDLNLKIVAVRNLAREYADAYVPLDGLFADASVRKPPAVWAGDGVHPTDEGAWLIARHYTDAIASVMK